jgi:hypothetical protein
MNFTRLSVQFNLKDYDGLANLFDIEQLRFQSNEHRIYTFQFAPKRDHVQRTLEVKMHDQLN